MAAKPRCPKCNRVARNLYERLSSREPYTPVPDAARCPTCGSFLLKS